MKVFSLEHGARRAASSEQLNAETLDLMAKQGGHGCTVDTDRMRMGYYGGLGMGNNSYNTTLISFLSLCSESFYTTLNHYNYEFSQIICE